MTTRRKLARASEDLGRRMPPQRGRGSKRRTAYASCRGGHASTGDGTAHRKVRNRTPTQPWRLSESVHQARERSGTRPTDPTPPRRRRRATPDGRTRHPRNRPQARTKPATPVSQTCPPRRRPAQRRSSATAHDNGEIVRWRANRLDFSALQRRYANQRRADPGVTCRHLGAWPVDGPAPAAAASRRPTSKEAGNSIATTTSELRKSSTRCSPS
jgi:hypothetical protein